MFLAVFVLPVMTVGLWQLYARGKARFVSVPRSE
jgi:hypothetical protein